MRISLNLKKETWENMFRVIRNNEIKPEGNFWAGIQHLETQFEEVIEEQTEFKNFKEDIKNGGKSK